MSSLLSYLEDKLPGDAMELLKGEEARGNDCASIIYKERLVPVNILLLALSRQCNLPAMEVSKYRPQAEAVNMISEETARRFKILPLFKLNDSLYMATSDPDNLETEDYIRQLTGMAVNTVMAVRSDLESAINREYLSKEKAEKVMDKLAEREKLEEIREEEIRIEDENAPVIKVVNYILSQGINLGASDIHIEPYPDRISLRYRIDGVLHEFPAPPRHIERALVARIKILSNMDIAERRLPQDGRANITVGGKKYDLRISIMANLYGESVVIRILDTEGKGVTLDEIGFSPVVRERFRKLLKRPTGIILVTGPTGSGKSTTLYASLKFIYTPHKKIITLEDPVEYYLDGIDQIPVRADIGMTFARGLRSILRHDPDVIMVGEIRDLESAEISVRASLTGHLVFSTLHTNDAPSSVVRLIDIGVPAYLVFSSLKGIMAQRLVRRLCPECREKYSPDRAQLESLETKDIPAGAQFYRAVGCSKCAGIGYKGRIAIFELLEINSEMKKLTGEAATPEMITRLAKKDDFQTLKDSALQRVFAGITSIEEIMSVVSMDD